MSDCLTSHKKDASTNTYERMCAGKKRRCSCAPVVLKSGRGWILERAWLLGTDKLTKCDEEGRRRRRKGCDLSGGVCRCFIAIVDENFHSDGRLTSDARSPETVNDEQAIVSFLLLLCRASREGQGVAEANRVCQLMIL